MRRFLTLLAGIALTGGVAMAAPVFTPEAPTFYSNVTFGQVLSSTAANITIHDNSAATATAAFAQTNTSEYGDTVGTTGTGTLDQMIVAIYNKSGSVGSFTGGTLTVNIYTDSGTGTRKGTLLGGFTADLSTLFAGANALPGGFFSRITFPGLAGLATPINLTSTNLMITQSLSGVTTSGGAVTMGTAYTGAPPIGTDPTPTTMYLNDGTNNGFFGFTGAPPASQIFQLQVLNVPEPTSMALIGLAGMGIVARRRRA